MQVRDKKSIHNLIAQSFSGLSCDRFGGLCLSPNALWRVNDPLYRALPDSLTVLQAKEYRWEAKKFANRLSAFVRRATLDREP